MILLEKNEHILGYFYVGIMGETKNIITEMHFQLPITIVKVYNGEEIVEVHVTSYYTISDTIFSCDNNEI